MSRLLRWLPPLLIFAAVCAAASPVARSEPTPVNGTVIRFSEVDRVYVFAEGQWWSWIGGAPNSVNAEFLARYGTRILDGPPPATPTPPPTPTPTPAVAAPVKEFLFEGTGSVRLPVEGTVRGVYECQGRLPGARLGATFRWWVVGKVRVLYSTGYELRESAIRPNSAAAPFRVHFGTREDYEALRAEHGFLYTHNVELRPPYEVAVHSPGELTWRVGCKALYRD